MEKCIICNEKKIKFSIEHVIPDSLGGTIKCFQVCETCNNLLGKKIDAPFTETILQYLFRVKHKIKGKRKTIPQKKMKFSANGKDYFFDLADNTTKLIPYTISSDKNSRIMLFDEKDSKALESAKIGFEEKALKEEKTIDIKIFQEVERVDINIKEESSIPLINIYLEFLKVAHEALFLFDDSYKNTEIFFKNQKFLLNSLKENINDSIFEKEYSAIFKFSNVPFKFSDLYFFRTLYFDAFKSYNDIFSFLKEIHIINIDFKDIHLKIGNLSVSFYNFFPEGNSKIIILQVPNEQSITLQYSIEDFLYFEKSFIIK